MDALSDVLRVAHLTGGVFLHAEFFQFVPQCKLFLAVNRERKIFLAHQTAVRVLFRRDWSLALLMKH